MTPCSACGRTARRSRRATRGPTCGCLSCTGRSRRSPPRRARSRARPGGGRGAPRPPPPRAFPREARALLRQPRRATLDGIEVEYVRFISPPRPGHYGSWGAWAAPAAALGLRRLRRRFPFDLVHAHNAVPAADAVLRTGIGAPLVVSVHGSDVFHTARRFDDGRAAVRRAFGSARLVLANSAGIERATRALGARRTRVVHLGTDPPPS